MAGQERDKGDEGRVIAGATDPALLFQDTVRERIAPLHIHGPAPDAAGDARNYRVIEHPLGVEAAGDERRALAYARLVDPCHDLRGGPIGHTHNEVPPADDVEHVLRRAQPLLADVEPQSRAERADPFAGDL